MTEAKKPTPRPKSNGRRPASKVPSGPVVYPQLLVNGIPIPPEKCIITRAKARMLLDWETEADYAARKLAENPKLGEVLAKLRAVEDPTPEQEAKLADAEAKVSFGNDYLLRDEHGAKVRCWNNLRNRPWNESTGRGYAQDILNRQWAGVDPGDTVAFPLHESLGGGTVELPALTLNGETIIVGRTGQVESGQHRLIGLELACQIWERNKPRWEHLWPEEPYLVSLLVQGVSEDTRVVRTLDNVRPRGLDDVFYTSDLFATMSPPQRKKLSRMMKNQVDLLWQRTGAGEERHAHDRQTHSESLAWVERHGGGRGKVLQALKLLAELDAANEVNAQKVWAGHAAALCWLMACSGTDEAVYRREELPGERHLDFGRWEAARAFWAAFVAAAPLSEEELAMPPAERRVRDPRMVAVCDAINQLASEGGGARRDEKFALLSRAWAAWQERGEVTPADVDISGDYADDPKTGQRTFVGGSDFGGIDRGSGGDGKGRDVPPAEVESVEDEKAAIREELAASMQATVDAARAVSNGPPPIALHSRRAPGEPAPAEDGAVKKRRPQPKNRPAEAPEPVVSDAGNEEAE